MLLERHFVKLNENSIIENRNIGTFLLYIQLLRKPEKGEFLDTRHFSHKLYNSYDAAAEPTLDSYVPSFHQAQVLLKQDDSLPQVSIMGQSDYRFLLK